MIGGQYRAKIHSPNGGHARVEKFSAFDDDAAIAHCLSLRRLGLSISILEHEDGELIQSFRSAARREPTD